MKWILSNEYTNVLARFANARALVAFDYDGTLTAIAAARHAVFMPEHTQSLLAEVAARYPCAVISGRKYGDILARLGGVDLAYVVGNHGLEPHPKMSTFEREIASITPELERALPQHRGIDIENKVYSLSIHYRQAKDHAETRALILEAITKLSRPVRTMLGKLVVNVLPADAPHKGDALVALREQEGAEIAMYVGDDVTDEDVFAMNDSQRLLGIRVGHSVDSAAPWYLHDQYEIDALLERLVSLRAAQFVVGQPKL